MVNNLNIILIGMPGCGKSTIGEQLGQKLNMEFIDLDKYIESKEGRSVSEIFLKGEDHFRNVESSAAEEVSEKKNVIIATGGGIVKNYRNIDTLKSNGIIFFIDRPVESILEDIDSDKRPLLKDNKNRLYQLYNERYNLYRDYCHYKVENTNSLDDVINKIIGIISKAE